MRRPRASGVRPCAHSGTSHRCRRRPSPGAVRMRRRSHGRCTRTGPLPPMLRAVGHDGCAPGTQPGAVAADWPGVGVIVFVAGTAAAVPGRAPPRWSRRANSPAFDVYENPRGAEPTATGEGVCWTPSISLLLFGNVTKSHWNFVVRSTSGSGCCARVANITPSRCRPIGALDHVAAIFQPVPARLHPPRGPSPSQPPLQRNSSAPARWPVTRKWSPTAPGEEAGSVPAVAPASAQHTVHRAVGAFPAPAR